MRRILFVDDEPRILDGLKRMLHSMRREWEMVFALSGQQALDLLGSGSFNVIISDMRMPGMDGHQLLEKVRQAHPQVVRIWGQSPGIQEPIRVHVRVVGEDGVV
jgi:YesN/AraC family two-component response regulator